MCLSGSLPVCHVAVLYAVWLLKRVGCSHAVKYVVEHFTSKNFTVNLCDKLNHYALFRKLVDRNVPLVRLKVLVNWYNMLTRM